MGAFRGLCLQRLGLRCRAVAGFQGLGFGFERHFVGRVDRSCLLGHVVICWPVEAILPL